MGTQMKEDGSAVGNERLTVYCVAIVQVVISDGENRCTSERKCCACW